MQKSLSYQNMRIKHCVHKVKVPVRCSFKAG